VNLTDDDPSNLYREYFRFKHLDFLTIYYKSFVSFIFSIDEKTKQKNLVCTRKLLRNIHSRNDMLKADALQFRFSIHYFWRTDTY